MQILLSIAAALLIGSSAIFSKLALQRGKVTTINSIANMIVLLCFLGDAILNHSLHEISLLTNYWAIILSGVTLALSWDLYLRGMKKGPVSIVLGIQNLSIPLTMIMSSIFLREGISWKMAVGGMLILLGSLFLLEMSDIKAWKRSRGGKHGRGEDRSGESMTGSTGEPESEIRGMSWLVDALLAALLVAISYVFTKVDTGPVSSSVSGMIRYILLVLVLLIIPILRREKTEDQGGVTVKSRHLLAFGILVFLTGLFMGIGYVCLYRAIAIGSVSVPTTIYRLNIIYVAILSTIVFKEPMQRHKLLGMAVMILGLVIFTMGS